MLLRQTLYFGVPLGILSAGALVVLNGPGANYVGYMLRGGTLYQQGRTAEALDEARGALASMQWQLPLARRLVELEPTAEREASLAFLVYNSSRYEQIVIPSLTGGGTDRSGAVRYRDEVREAVGLLEHALERGGPIGDFGGKALRREDAYATLVSWRLETMR
jgi:hypothetical protein